MATVLDLPARLAASLPDEPRWLETRAMLRSGHATVFGGTTPEAGFAVRMLHGAFSVAAVVGCPPPAAIVAALEGTTGMTPLLAQTDNADYVERVIAGGAGRPEGDWGRERVIVHTHGRFPVVMPPDHDVAIRLLSDDDALDHLPAGLRFEMMHAREVAPVAAAFVGGVAASFCYPCWTSESLWDVSIDTLSAYRGRGLAAHVVQFMTAHMRREGREPVWAAIESNRASLRLAERLGFTAVGEIVAFARGPWAFLTNGYGE
jgi:GNAT superfamily N-acetyltransferase